MSNEWLHWVENNNKIVKGVLVILYLSKEMQGSGKVRRACISILYWSVYTE